MDNELSVKQQGVVSVIKNNDLGDVLKPLINEIHLFDSYVAGTTHLKDSSVLKEIKPGDYLMLLREENKFDDNAIVIMTEDKRKIGYVPEKDNVIFARLMDAGKLLKAKITLIDENEYMTRISIGIYLVDF